METQLKQLPFIRPEGTNELRKIAVRFEEKLFNNASNQVILCFSSEAVTPQFGNEIEFFLLLIKLIICFTSMS